MKKFTFYYILILSIITLLTGCRTICPPHDYYIKQKKYSPDTTQMNFTRFKSDARVQ